jgi:hypothetical protein
VSVLRLRIKAKAGHWETEKADPQTPEAIASAPSEITRSRKTYNMGREGVGGKSRRDLVLYCLSNHNGSLRRVGRGFFILILICVECVDL